MSVRYKCYLAEGLSINSHSERRQWNRLPWRFWKICRMSQLSGCRHRRVFPPSVKNIWSNFHLSIIAIEALRFNHSDCLSLLSVLVSVSGLVSSIFVSVRQSDSYCFIQKVSVLFSISLFVFLNFLGLIFVYLTFFSPVSQLTLLNLLFAAIG